MDFVRSAGLCQINSPPDRPDPKFQTDPLPIRRVAQTARLARLQCPTMFRLRLLGALSLLSLVLCGITAVLWVRSYGPQDALERYVYQQYESADWDIDDKWYSVRGTILWVHRRHRDLYG